MSDRFFQLPDESPPWETTTRKREERAVSVEPSARSPGVEL
jgi:hypothetical protein